MTREELIELWQRAQAVLDYENIPMGDLAELLGVSFFTLRLAQRNSYDSVEEGKNENLDIRTKTGQE